MVQFVWDVREFQNKEARLSIIDNDPGSWGHIVVDQVILY
jgi:hypothetical protein